MNSRRRVNRLKSVRNNVLKKGIEITEMKKKEACFHLLTICAASTSRKHLGFKRTVNTNIFQSNLFHKTCLGRFLGIS